MKKTWIKIKRGLLDPKHVRAVGPAHWIFDLMVDGANWDTGIVQGWTDKQAAETLGLKRNTARDWRQRLERYGYISCQQVGQSLDVQIHNWTNPREYGGDVRSRNKTRPADVGDGWDAGEGSVQTEPLETEGSVPGSVPGDVSPQDLPLEPHTTSHGEEKQRGYSQDDWVRAQVDFKRQSSKANYKRFIEPTWMAGRKDGVVTVVCERGQDQASWLRDHLALTAAKILMCREVRFVVAADVSA